MAVNKSGGYLTLQIPANDAVVYGGRDITASKLRSEQRRKLRTTSRYTAALEHHVLTFGDQRRAESAEFELGDAMLPVASSRRPLLRFHLELLREVVKRCKSRSKRWRAQRDFAS
jgi:hypothetical protein